MSITFPVSLPSTPGIQKITFGPNATVGISISPFTRQQQTFEWPGDYWTADVVVPPMKRDAAEAWVTFLTLVRGMSGTFYLGDPAATAPRGVATGTPQVNGTNAAASKTLATKGWTHNVTGILLAGDYIQVGSGTQQRLYKNLTDANSDSSGNATLDIFPRLREGVSDGQAITLVSAAGTFRLADNTPSWDVDEAQVYGINFKTTEAF